MSELPKVNLPLALATVGLNPWAASGEALNADELLRRQLGVAGAHGIRAVQLNATQAGMRPRELSRSDRRELAAMLRRANLAFAGLDLFIPPEHFTSGRHQDRAVAALSEALEMCGDLRTLAASAGGSLDAHVRRPGVSVQWPRDLSKAIRDHLAANAETAGVTIIDHTFTADAPPEGWFAGPVCHGLDPAAVAMGGGDAVAVAAKVGATLGAARLCDVSSSGRRGVGFSGGIKGRLDVPTYAMTLAAVGYGACVTLDLRDVPEPVEAVKAAVALWPG